MINSDNLGTLPQGNANVTGASSPSDHVAASPELTAKLQASNAMDNQNSPQAVSGESTSIPQAQQHRSNKGGGFNR